MYDPHFYRDQVSNVGPQRSNSRNYFGNGNKNEENSNSRRPRQYRGPRQYQSPKFDKTPEPPVYENSQPFSSYVDSTKAFSTPLPVKPFSPNDRRNSSTPGATENWNVSEYNFTPNSKARPKRSIFSPDDTPEHPKSAKRYNPY